MTDLADPATRAAVTERLGRELWGDRPVVLGPLVLAAAPAYVGWLRRLGCRVLVVATSRGAGPVPAGDECEVVWVELPAAASVTEELRTHDRLVRHLPDDVRAAIDAFDPEGRGLWMTAPFVTTDEPIDGRPVLGGRPAAFLALEDKLFADGLWEAAGIARSPYHHVAVDDDAGIAAAVEELEGPLGTVWSGDARDGFNGGGDFVRWVVDATDRVEALAFFRPRCDRVRVLPFLEGVPCSVHGFVLPDGTAALRPVEIVVLRDPARRRFAYSGLGTTWDPPESDRAEMREAVHRVGAHLQEAHGYRGAFGIDGVLTADGFRPTELNTRMSAGATQVTEVDRAFFVTLQTALVAGVDTGLTAREVEAMLPLLDAHRGGRVICVGDHVAAAESYPVTWDGTSFARSEEETGSVFSIGPTPTGSFARVEPCTAVREGQRLAPLCAALVRFVDATYGAGVGPVEPAPDVRATA